MLNNYVKYFIRRKVNGRSNSNDVINFKKIGLDTVCAWFPKCTKDELIENINDSEKLELKGNMVYVKETEVSEATRAWMNI